MSTKRASKYNWFYEPIEERKSIYDNLKVKITNFGFWNYKQMMLKMDQTPIEDIIFYAPEILKQVVNDKGVFQSQSNKNNAVGFQSDLWSIGLILYIMIYGCYPFITRNKEQVIK